MTRGPRFSGPKKVVSVVMPMRLYDKLKALAEEQHRSIPGSIRMILWEHTERKDEE